MLGGQLPGAFQPAGSYATTGINIFTGGQSIFGGLSLNSTGTATAANGYKSNPLDALASVYNSGAASAQSHRFRWQAEPVADSNNTANPLSTLNLLFDSNGTPSETGLSVNSNGTINFAPGQSFSGSGSGTITGVTAGTGLSGGGTTGTVTLTNGGILSLTAGTGVNVTSGQNPTVGLNTTYTDGRYLQLTGTAAVALTAGSLTGNITESQVTGLSTDFVPTSAKGQANGVASLDASGKVPTSQIPASGSSTPAILTGSCSGVASSTSGATFAFTGLGELANGSCSNGTGASTVVGIPVTSSGTLANLHIYPGDIGNGGTNLTFTVYKATGPGWSVGSTPNQTALSALSFNRNNRLVTLTVASGSSFIAGDSITISGITGTYNAGTRCGALAGSSFDGTYTVSSSTATTTAYTDSALPTNCGSNIGSAGASGTVADDTHTTVTTTMKTVPTATALTCTIAALSTAASAVCADTSDTVAVNAGDLISVVATSGRTSGTETIGEIRVSLEKH